MTEDYDVAIAEAKYVIAKLKWETFEGVSEK